MLARRTLLALAAALVTGCSGTADVTISKRFAGVALPGGGQTYSLSQHVDLAAEGGAAWQHRGDLQALELVGLDVTMTAVNSGGPARGNGVIQLSRGGGTPVPVGRWSNELLQAAPHSIAVALDAAGASLIEDALHGDGAFDVALAGSTDTAINLDADVTLHVKARFKLARL
jgi:hypothetical protein